MKKNSKMTIIISIAIVIIINIAIMNYSTDFSEKTKTLYVDVVSEENQEIHLYYSNDKEFSDESSQMVYYDAKSNTGRGTLTFEIPLEYRNYIISFNGSEERNVIDDIYYNYYFIKESVLDEGTKKLQEDGTFYFILSDRILHNGLNQVQHTFQQKMNFVFCIVLDIAIYVLAKHFFQLIGLVKELIENRTMILRLGKNDFKTRFAGSYLGVIWAFIQPVVTVLVYWFVFQVGFRSSPVGDFPFVLWLTTGMVPWFFFSEAWNAGTNSLTDYTYLVKKVVFNISTIPVVKVVSALFVHVFFVAFTMVLYIIYGYKPDIYWVQVVYYSFCLLVMVIALAYLCSAIMVFFRDLSQVISVVLQVGIWLSCIMWSVDMLPERVRWVMYLNPIYYIVSGYRSSLITKEWFWETPYQTLGFWAFVVVLMSVGVNVFNKLRVHFADVL